MLQRGDFGSDMAASADALRVAGIFQKRVQSEASVAEQNGQLADEMMEVAAANYGVRAALAAQVERFDPANPLLKDANLVERVKKAAIAAFHVNGKDFGAAREVGRTFSIPGRVGQAAAVAAGPRPATMAAQLLKNDPEQMKLAYAGALAHRNALAEQLRKLDPENPLLKDLMLVERIKNSAQAAYKIGGDDFGAARDVGDSFQVPGR